MLSLTSRTIKALLKKPVKKYKKSQSKTKDDDNFSYSLLHEKLKLFEKATNLSPSLCKMVLDIQHKIITASRLKGHLGIFEVDTAQKKS